MVTLSSPPQGVFSPPPITARRMGSTFAAALAAGLRALSVWSARARQRRRLLALDERMLADIGLGRADQLREGAKPFWKP